MFSATVCRGSVWVGASAGGTPMGGGVCGGRAGTGGGSTRVAGLAGGGGVALPVRDRARSARSSAGITSRGVSSEIEWSSSRPRSHAAQTGVRRIVLTWTSGASTAALRGGGWSKERFRTRTPPQGVSDAPPTRVSNPVRAWILRPSQFLPGGLANQRLGSSSARNGSKKTTMPMRWRRRRPRRIPRLGAPSCIGYFFGAGLLLASGKRITRLLSSSRVPSVESSCTR